MTRRWGGAVRICVRLIRGKGPAGAGLPTLRPGLPGYVAGAGAATLLSAVQDFGQGIDGHWPKIRELEDRERSLFVP